MYEVADAMIDNCTFTSNTTNRGTLYPVDCGNVHISNCEFTLNENQSGFGGAMFVWQTMHLTIENCDFIDNTSFQAAGMYYDAREIAFNNPSLTIRDCLYQDNRASGGFGGAFTLWQGTNIMIDACEFTRNTANNAGAFTYNGTESPKMNEDDGVHPYTNVMTTFTTGSHTSTLIPVFSYGPGMELFDGIFDNSDMFHKMLEAAGDSR